MVIMASGIVLGRMRTTAMESRNRSKEKTTTTKKKNNRKQRLTGKEEAKESRELALEKEAKQF